MDDSGRFIEVIRNKLEGKHVGLHEIYSVMNQISSVRFPHGEVAYTNGEIYYLIKRLTQSQSKLHFSGIAADAYCVEDAFGSAVPLLVTPIVVAAGFVVPKRLVNLGASASDTADIMEILAPVQFSRGHIAQLVHRAGGCVIREADEDRGAVDSDTLLVSIIAHQISSGLQYFIVDLPYGDYSRFSDLVEAESFKHRIINLAQQFHIQTHVSIHKSATPSEFGIGPALAGRDVLRILEQKDVRSHALESHAVALAGKLLDLCLEDSHTSPVLKKRIALEFGSGLNWARYILHSGHALSAMKEIIMAQGGDKLISSDSLAPGKFSFDVLAKHSTTLSAMNGRNAIIISRILGAPQNKKSGIYFYAKPGDHIQEGMPLFSLYSEHEYNLSEARDSLDNFPIFV